MSENNVVDVNFKEVEKEGNVANGAEINESAEQDTNKEVKEAINIPSAEEFKKPQMKQFSTVDEALQYQLFTRINQLKEAEDLDDYCIINRFDSADFIFAFKDALNSYREDVVLCERLYKKDLCQTEKRQVYTLPEAAQKISAELTEYVKSIDPKKQLSEEEIKVVNEKVKEYQDKLKADDMKPILQDTDVLVYKDASNKDLLMQPLSDINNDVIDQHCSIIAKFILSYFLSMRFLVNNNYELNVTPVKSGDYIDIIAIIKLK